MSTATTIEATVVTLTAEIRVLFVNNRQVTLSVAQQLDIVEWHEMEPMGRVFMRRRDSLRDSLRSWLIGRSDADGTLVMAEPAKPALIPTVFEPGGRM